MEVNVVSFTVRLLLLLTVRMTWKFKHVSLLLDLKHPTNVKESRMPTLHMQA